MSTVQRRTAGQPAPPHSTREQATLRSTTTLVVEGDWEEIAQRYWPKFYGWLRRRGLQDADARDGAQDTVLRLLKAAHLIDPKGNFRGLFKTVVKQVAANHLKSRARSVPPAGDPKLIESVSDEAERELDHLFDPDLDRLVDAAVEKVRNSVRSAYWIAFCLRFAGRPAAEAAKAAGIVDGSVYVYVRRVGRELRSALECLACRIDVPFEVLYDSALGALLKNCGTSEPRSLPGASENEP